MIINRNDNENEKNSTNSFLEYTKKRQRYGLNNKKNDRNQKKIEYLRKKQKEIGDKLDIMEKSIDDRKGNVNKAKSLTNGLVIGGGYNSTREYNSHRDLTKEQNATKTFLYYSKYKGTNYKKTNEINEVNKMEEKEVYLTQEGYNKLNDELVHRRTVLRDEIAEKIKVAKSYGDLSENSEYDEAKTAQENNEREIASLEETLKEAKIIDESNMNTEIVQVGSTVYITNISSNKEQRYTIVGTAETNILEGKISNQSPIAKSLLGSKVGDIVQVEAPVGIVEYKIKKITI